MSRSRRSTGRSSRASSWSAATRTTEARTDMDLPTLDVADRRIGLEAATSVPVLELVKIGKQFGTDPAVHALTDVDLTLEAGDWLAITGPSGSGKSTLLNIIGCLDRPTSGGLRFDGIDTTGLTE